MEKVTHTEEIKMSGVKLSLSAVRQILTGQGLKPPEEDELIKKIEETARKFDGSGRGELSDREVFNVLKMQHKVNISQEKVFAILAHIPRTSNGKMRIDEFINLPILSEEAFNAIDRNKDGFLTMGEIKLVNKNATKNEIKETIQEYDFDKDGKLNTAEYHQYLSDHEHDDDSGSEG